MGWQCSWPVATSWIRTRWSAPQAASRPPSSASRVSIGAGDMFDILGAKQKSFSGALSVFPWRRRDDARSSSGEIGRATDLEECVPDSVAEFRNTGNVIGPPAYQKKKKKDFFGFSVQFMQKGSDEC